jgi:hypothetical protein
MGIFNRLKINREYNFLKKDIENKLKKSLKSSGFNPISHFNGFDYQLENYMYEEILYCLVRASYSNDINEQRFHSNILIRLLASFLDLYAQILNSFYDLELDPLRNNITPIYGDYGIVKQAINGVDNLKRSKPVTLKKVYQSLESNYSSNEYFDNIKEIIHSKELESLNILRNYVTHYQSIFSRYSQNYSFDNNKPIKRIFRINGSILDKQEHDDFISLALKIINLEVDLIFNFKLMYYNKKMIKKNESTKIAYVLECPDCKRKFPVTEVIKKFYEENGKLKIEHKEIVNKKDCLSEKYLNLTNETIEIHPEKFGQLLSIEKESGLNGDYQFIKD